MPKITDRYLRKVRDTVVATVGGPTAVAEHVKVSQAAVSQWSRIPWKHVEKLEELTGISRHVMRPDIYGKPSADRTAGATA